MSGEKEQMILYTDHSDASKKLVNDLIDKGYDIRRIYSGYTKPVLSCSSCHLEGYLDISNTCLS